MFDEIIYAIMKEQSKLHKAETNVLNGAGGKDKGKKKGSGGGANGSGGQEGDKKCQIM